MRHLLRFTGITVAVFVAVLVAALIWLQDANRLKGDIERLIAERSDYQVRIEGDLSWQLWPPLKLTVKDLYTTRDDLNIHAGALDLKMDLSAAWQDVNQWQVDYLDLRRVNIQTQTANIELKTLKIEQFKLDQAAPFHLDAVRRQGESEQTLVADGWIRYVPAGEHQGERLILSDMALQTQPTDGTCNVDVTRRVDVDLPQVELPEDAVLPLDLLHAHDLNIDCQLSRLNIGEEVLSDATLNATNLNKRLNANLQASDLFGGELTADIDVRYNTSTPEWTITPDINGLDSQRLLSDRNRRYRWIATLALNSDIRMRGNTPQALADSIEASSEFDGGQGQVNVTHIKQQVLALATLAQQADDVSQWPEVLHYQDMVGRWQIQGRDHNLQFKMDNMEIDATGTYDFANGTVDLLANVTLREALEGSPFRVNPTLQDTPIPIRCRGEMADPQCRLDRDATKNLVARALQSDDTSGLRSKLEEKIEDKVPEKYRETARGLLDLLGRKLERD